MTEQMTRRLLALWWAIELIVLCTVNLVLFVLTITGVVLVVVWVGIPIVTVTARVTRALAQYRRRKVGAMLGREIESPYLQPPDGNMLRRVAALAADPAVRRDVLWLLADGLIGLVLACVAVAEGVLDLLFWWLPLALAGQLHARIDHALLSVSETSRLALRVEQLTESRAETVDTSAAELRRIERDLHDGAQARLVAIGMSLGLAEEQLARDPDQALSLLLEARDTASDALSELRDLVRGIHPPVLADRGLVEAVRALAGALPMPVDVQAEVPDRLPAPIESAAYFAVAESVTNVIKHASAKHITIRLTRANDDLELFVEDDGIGGADPTRGTGLRGIARRLSAFDGTLVVDSPRGGPTRVVMVLPCASSSPKISPSSGKD